MYGLPSVDDGQSSPPLKSEECQSPPSDSSSNDSNQTKPPPAEAKPASVPTEKKMSSVYEDDKYPPRECFIPKKLYCMQSNAGAGRSSTPTTTTDRDPSLPPVYPTQRQSSPVEYSETDVSVAMILATGFGRKRRSESPVIEEV